MEQISVEEKEQKQLSVKFKRCRMPLWVAVFILSALPLIAVAICITAIIYTSGQNQVDVMYQNLRNMIQISVEENFDDYFTDMKLAARTVQKADPEIYSQAVPEYSDYDPTQLIQLMNSFSGSQAFESMGFLMKKPNGTGTQKLGWEVARGFGCPEYIYAWGDLSIYPGFYGYCAFPNLTVDSSAYAFQGTDWGLKPDEVKIVEGTISETFLPIFPLIDYFTLSYAIGIPRNDGSGIYGFTFAQRSLSLIDQFLSSVEIGESGVIYVIERNGLLVSASAVNQTTLVVDNNVQRVNASDASNELISSSFRFLESKIGLSDSIGETEAESFRETLDGKELLIDVKPYSDTGIDWLVVIVVPSSDFFSSITKSSQLSLGLAALIVIIALIATILWARFVLKPLSTIKRNMEKLALLQFKDLEPSEPGSTLSEIRDIQEGYNVLEQELMKSKK